MKALRRGSYATKYSGNVNVAMQVKLMGLLLLIEACFMLVPLVACIILKECDWRPFLITVLITASAGFLMKFLIHPKSE